MNNYTNDKIDKEINLTVSFTTLGCKVNQFETEAMSEILENDGFKIVPIGEKTDIFIINTCVVTNESERKSRQLINKAKRINKNAIVVAVGCSVQLNGDKLNEETNVDIIIGTKNKSNISNIIKKYIEEIGNIENTEYYEIEQFNKNECFEELKINQVHDKTRANIKIQDGCSQFCSYCIIPFVRGPIRSRDHDDIIEEVKNVSKNGYKEIVLNGIHISSYGAERREKDALIKLIEEINNIDGIERIRLGSLEPNIINDNFASRLSKLNKFCHHFHLSLQSGSDTVLNRMNRKYTKGQYQINVDTIRKYMPDSGITTDIIVGFPGETEEEFVDTYNFIKQIGFSRVHVFKYSIREKTKAAEMENQVEEKIKNSRSKALIELGEEVQINFMKEFIGCSVDVLIENQKENNLFEGYTKNYLKVLIKSVNNIRNEIINVNIINLSNDYLIAE